MILEYKTNFGSVTIDTEKLPYPDGWLAVDDVQGNLYNYSKEPNKHIVDACWYISGDFGGASHIISNCIVEDWTESLICLGGPDKGGV